MCPPVYGGVRTEGDISVLQGFHGMKILLLNEATVFEWGFSVFGSAETFIPAKLVINHLKTLHKSRKDLSSVRSVGDLSPQIASVACDASSKRLERITWPR